jgi:hypothetical protein
MKVLRLLAVLALCAPAAYAADEQCGSVGPFHLKHCPLGDAYIVINVEDIIVSSFTDSGKDGVSIALPEGTTSWRLKSSVQGAVDGMRFEEVADISNGFITSRVVVTATHESTQIVGYFTGSPNATYTAIVSLNGTVQASQSGISSGGLGPIAFPTPEPIPFPRIPDFPPVTPGPFGILQDSLAKQGTAGACVWELPISQNPATARMVLFRLPNGKRAWGDKIRLVEDVPGAKSYPYTSFSGIAVKASGVESITLSNETVQ